MDNLLISNVLDADSYKFSHVKQYPPNTTAMFSYFESRGGDDKLGMVDYTVFFGLQYYLKRYLSQRITVEQVEEAKEFSELHGVPFNYDGWMYIAKELDGKLPVKIRAVPEGTKVPKLNILMSVESTDSKCFWVVSWFETMLVRLWYSLTVCTHSYQAKQIIKKYLDETSDCTEDEIGFKLHDFGSRGATSQESAMIGGASHLVNFLGSDTIAGVWMANKYYNEKMSAFSIAASEHSTITMWGKENEVDAYRNMIKQYGDGPIFACVSDSYNIYYAAENLWGRELKKEVEEMNATLVVRPDSGNVVEIVCSLLVSLDRNFGSTINTKGFKVLNNVRVIQGDGIDKDDISIILFAAKRAGYSATNISFGMGGGLIQKDMNRDTHKFAFKCSWAVVDGKEVEVYKDPITDKGKVSKRGKLDLIKENGEFKTIQGESKNSELVTVFENGDIVKEWTLQEVRDRLNNA